MTTKSFIITALQPWDTLPQSDTSLLAKALAKQAKVLYVNPPLDMMSLIENSGRRDTDRRRRVLDGSDPMIRHIESNLWVIEPPVVISQPSRIHSNKVFDMLNRRNNKRLASVIKWAANHIQLDKFTLLIDNDIINSQHLDEFLNPEYLAYYRRLDVNSLPNADNSLRRLEMALIAKSDVVLTSSKVLAEQVESLNPNTFNIGRGTQLETFDPTHRYPVPTDMMTIHRPVIGCQCDVLGDYTVSADLLYRVAKAYHDYSIVLIGGEDNHFSSHKLHSLPNIYFLGSKTLDELPAYINLFDLCLAPQPDNSLTRTNHPDNILYYLAMGKCVVANYREPIRQFASKIHLAMDSTEFIGLVGIGLHEGSSGINTPLWTSYAQRYVWDNCAERIMAILDLVRYGLDMEILAEESLETAYN